MRYAVVADGVVENLIELEERNTADFPEAIPVGERPVAIGDACDGRDFFRDGAMVCTELERRIAAEALRNDETDAALVELAGLIAGEAGA